MLLVRTWSKKKKKKKEKKQEILLVLNKTAVKLRSWMLLCDCPTGGKIRRPV